MLRTFAAVIFAWAVGMELNYLPYIPWFWWGLTNLVCCFIVTMRPANRMQSLIGGTFFAAFVVHGAYGIAAILERIVSTPLYLNMLDQLSIIQIALCVIWAGGRCAEMARHRLFPSRRKIPSSSSMASME